MSLTDYRTLGRSGLVASPLALGTMTFGAGRWGTEEDSARAIFDAYRPAGGNLIDTADVYGGGASEEIVGRLIRAPTRATSSCCRPRSGSAVGWGRRTCTTRSISR